MARAAGKGGGVEVLCYEVCEFWAAVFIFFFFNLRLLERLLAAREIVCKNILIELSTRFLLPFRALSLSHTHRERETRAQFLLISFISLFVKLLTLI